MSGSKKQLLFPLLALLLPLISPLSRGAITLTPSLNDDVLGLIVFKADLQDPKGMLSSWNEDDDTPCNWVGVKCNSRSNRVTELVLDNLSLSGRIGRGILQLQFLRRLSLSGNNLTGVLPPGMWKLTALRSIDLSSNRLEGEIPKGIELMNNLRSINMSSNKLSGEIPPEIGSCLLLRTVDLGQNSFSGDLPETLKMLSLCTSLVLSNNKFTGAVPTWVDALRNIEVLDLSGNMFSGQLPDSVGRAKSLKVLNMSRNRISGSLPKSIASCDNLVTLDVSENEMTGDLPLWIFGSEAEEFFSGGSKLVDAGKSLPNLEILNLSGNKFSGQISHSIGEITSLLFLNLSGNILWGSIPTTVGNLKQLVSLDLSNNHLNGSIPAEISGLVSLKDLRVGGNAMTGDIPSSLSNCSSLTTLVLAKNNFSGSVPAALGRLTRLEFVDLSFNSLSGSLPKQLSGLPNLSTFNISHNHLQGELPIGGFFNTIDPSSTIDNPLLCGAAVSKSCPVVLPKPIVLNPNSSDADRGPFPNNNLGHKRIILSISALIAIGAASVIVIGVIAVTVLNLRVRSIRSRTASAFALSGAGDDFSGSPHNTDANSGKLVMFSGEPDFSAGAHALLNKDCELGRGGFGAVYRTVLRDGRAVAIKKLTVSSLVKSQDDFEREVKKLGKVRHPNIVALDGYYWTPSLQLLIYEFVAGGSLHKRLHEGGNVLSWNERITIILGMAKALAQLHQQGIVHYNIKSSNVLLDTAGEAKVADFGLARLLPMLDRYVLSSKIQSALGYMAPEFACKTVKITEKCDVYGFGALVLEVVTGKKPVEYMEDDVVVLCDMVRGALEDGSVEACVDEKLDGDFPADEAVPVMKLGLICTSQVPSNRPDMMEVVKILELIRCPSQESA